MRLLEPWKAFDETVLCFVQANLVALDHLFDSQHWLDFFVSPVFLAVLPMIVVVFIYFALVRYDDEGNFTGA